MFRGPLLVLLARFALLLVGYSILRLCFVWLNADQFSTVPVSAFLGGLRFDISALAWLNLPWVAFVLFLPRPSRHWASAQRWTFLVINALGLFFACVDLEYYKFSLKRSTADFLEILMAGSDTVNLAPAFVRDYWYIALLFVALLWSLWWGYGRLARLDSGERFPLWRSIVWRAVAIVLVAIGSRGGTQLMPLQVMAAASYAPAHFVPVVLNTPFTILNSLGKPVLEERIYMAQPQADLLWPVIQHYPLSTAPALHIPARPNVVVIVLESFSAAYSAKLSGGPGYMPFLDALMDQSLTMTQAYANGRRSIDGIPAVLASIPELMDEAFITSNYAQQPFTSIASVLAAEGYATSFYHGGNNGTMGFDGFARSAGFQRYVGRNEYPVQEHYDGHWGIWDAPFLQFFAHELTKEQQPFLSCVFTLSSHHPYDLPPDLAARFAGGTQKIHPTLRYTDEALRRFFDTARSQPWFRNTLFVITADHTADLERSGQNYSKAIDYWIPLLYHMPAYLPPSAQARVTQHIDLLPTTLDLIGYHRPFFSFGHSALRPASPPYAVMASNQIYHMIGDRYQIGFDGTTLLGMEALGPDTVGPSGEPRDLVAFDMLTRTQAAIQQFNSNLLRNTLTVQPPAQ
ncbi:MAG: sulfatase-like hydrolase/transferase [Flavobacteriales bacterium]|nr:sulfatase-like hydrolase/transferase [Flavobacteriales bacterium]